MAEVSLRHVDKIYEKKVKAVSDFNLDIRDKEFIVLVGPSGCGKSTTLRMIAGLEEISSGDLLIGGVRMNDVAPKDRDIAMVFQNYALYPHMTVYENMAFALKLRKVEKKKIKERVMQVAEVLDITEYLQRKPKALSGGQRQRVAIGRAIVREPQVFLMDEPLSNLDAKLRNQMRAEIIKLHKRLDTTFIYVTHDQTEAMTLGDRIVIMKDGLIQQVDTPQGVFNCPENVFVAGFIGTPQMNFFHHSRLLRERDAYHVEISGRRIVLPEKMQEILLRKETPSMEVIAGLRPEHIEICADGTEDAFSARVDVSEMMGSEIHIHALLEDDTPVVLRVLSTDVLERLTGRLTGAERVFFRAVKGKIHLFHQETQKNLLVQ